MASLDVFLPDVLVHAPDAPDPYARLCLVRAAQEFCQRTFAWKAWLACVAGTSPNYTATALTDSQVVRLEGANLDGKPITPGQWWAADIDPAVNATNESAGVVSPDLITIVLNGPAGTLKVLAALEPTISATTLPDFLARRYLAAIAAGAAARLLLTSKASFFDPVAAGPLRTSFDEAIGAAGVAVMRGNTNTTSRRAIRWC